MSNAIQFLETLGREPAPARGEAEAYASAVDALEIDAVEQRALIERDPSRLNALLGGRGMMAMLIATPDGSEEPEETPDDHDGDDGESPEETPRHDEQPE